jgi:hypothetical protein
MVRPMQPGTVALQHALCEALAEDFFAHWSCLGFVDPFRLWDEGVRDAEESASLPAERDSGKRQDGLTTVEKEELGSLRREVRPLREERAQGECELLDRTRFQTQREARLALFEWIEGWYDLHRRHSSIGYLSPSEFERRHAQAEELGGSAPEAPAQTRDSRTRRCAKVPVLLVRKR